MHIALITLLLIAVTVLGGITAVHAQTPVPDVGQPANGADVARNPIVATNDTAFSNGIDELAIDILANDIFDGPVNVTLTPDYVDRHAAHPGLLDNSDAYIVQNVTRHHETEIIEDVGSAGYNGTHLVYTPGVFALSDRMILARYTYTIQDDMGRSDSAKLTIQTTRPVASAAVSDMRPDPTFLIAAYSTDPISGRILDDAGRIIYNFAGIKSAIEPVYYTDTTDEWTSLELRTFSPPVITEGIPDNLSDKIFDCDGGRTLCALSLITGIAPEFDAPLEPGTYTYQFARTADVNYTGSDVYTGVFDVSEPPEPPAPIPDPSNRDPVARDAAADVMVYIIHERFVTLYHPIISIPGITRDIYAAKAILLPVSDPDGDDLTITSVTGATLGTVFDQYLSRNTIAYIAGSPGTDIITYTVSDGRGGAATGKITVNVPVLGDRSREPPDDPVAVPPKDPVTVSPEQTPNRPPVAPDMQVTADPPFFPTTDEPLSGFVDYRDYAICPVPCDLFPTTISPGIDPDGDDLTITNVTGLTLGSIFYPELLDRGAISYMPNQTGTETITYTVSDGRGGTATGTITIYIQEPGIAIPVLGSITDTGALEAYMSRGLVAYAGVQEDATRTMQAGAARQAVQEPGSAGFLLASIITNGTEAGLLGAGPGPDIAGQNILAVSIDETGNVPPILLPMDDYAINAHDTLAFRVPATDSGRGALFYTLLGVPDGATVYGHGIFSWTPGSQDVGSRTFTIAVHDGQGYSDTESVTVTVLPAGTANEPPDAPDVTAAVAPGGQITIMPAISDPDGDPTRIASATGNAGGVIMPSGNSIQYIAGPNPGTETVTYTVADSRGAVSAGTITITIQ